MSGEDLVALLGSKQLGVVLDKPDAQRLLLALKAGENLEGGDVRYSEFLKFVAKHAQVAPSGVAERLNSTNRRKRAAGFPFFPLLTSLTPLPPLDCPLSHHSSRPRICGLFQPLASPSTAPPPTRSPCGPCGVVVLRRSNRSKTRSGRARAGGT